MYPCKGKQAAAPREAGEDKEGAVLRKGSEGWPGWNVGGGASSPRGYAIQPCWRAYVR